MLIVSLLLHQITCENHTAAAHIITRVYKIFHQNVKCFAFLHHQVLSRKVFHVKMTVPFVAEEEDGEIGDLAALRVLLCIETPIGYMPKKASAFGSSEWFLYVRVGALVPSVHCREPANSFIHK